MVRIFYCLGAPPQWDLHYLITAALSIFFSMGMGFSHMMDFLFCFFYRLGFRKPSQEIRKYRKISRNRSYLKFLSNHDWIVKSMLKYISID